MRKLKNKQKFVIFSITIGCILIWYELFLFVFWGPALSKIFFNPKNEIDGMFGILCLFSLGFFLRPIGGMIFGRIGDKYGRKVSFFSSLVLMIISSFGLAFLPTYAQIGFLAPILLGCMRILQGLPAGAELPGSMCYLAESSSHANRKYMCSYTFVGCQVGAILSMFESIFFEKFISHEFLVNYGWRIAFGAGGIIGIIGLYFRKNLDESIYFQNEKNETSIAIKPLLEAFKKYKQKMLLGFTASILEVIGYFMISVFSAIFLSKILKISAQYNLILIASILVLSVVITPYFGRLGDRFKDKNFLILSSIAIIILSVPLYLSILANFVTLTFLLVLLFVILLTMQFALLPAFLAELFPTKVRFTCIGLSFNICDSIVGGFTPILAMMLIDWLDNIAAFIFLVATAAMLSLLAFFTARKENHFSE